VDVLVQIAIGLATAAIGLIAGRVWERAKLFRQYSHVRTLLGPLNKIQIIVSNVEIPRFKFAMDGSEVIHQSPRNVLFMPMPEGRAVAALTSLLHKINPKVRVQLVTASNYDPEIATLSIGGPSVNAFSGKVLSTDFSEFKIEYPAAKRARYEGHIFETLRDKDNLLTRDYGFIFLTRTARGAPCLVFCGVMAFGTAIAVELFRSLPHRSEAAQLIRKGRKAFIVAEGSVDGLELHEAAVRLSFCRELPAVQISAAQMR
jgi:hypothetical protein